MMKMNILKNGFQALIIMSLMVACSLGDVLEPSDGVSMALMETVDTVVALPGDTISFKFIASTNGAALRRIEIVATASLMGFVLMLAALALFQ